MRATRTDGGSSTSFWAHHDPGDVAIDTHTEPASEAEVVIVGAGIAGLTTALELVRRGTRVLVLDDGPIGGGETGRTSAHLTSEIDDLYYELERKHGEHIAAVVA